MDMKALFQGIPNERLTKMELMETLCRRKSVRAYNGAAPTPEQMELILKAAQAAPVAMARFDSMHLTVITNAEFLGKLEAAGAAELGKPGAKMLYGAPVLVLVSAKIPEGTENSMYSSAAMIAHNMALEATELGVGSVDIWGCIRGAAKDSQLVAQLQLPEEFEPCCAIALGQTDEEFPVRDVPADKMAVSSIE